ncbi:MAG: phage tail protein, partial [Oscillospiraceae bacterium]|nr:phage tail protein [Oscillospiraceae bacterium]
VFTARDVVGELDILKALLADTETSIAGLEGDIEDLREELNLKAEDIQPVGSIRYSAAPDMGDDWLKCDGSFVSEDDYPELVALLGTKQPTAQDLKTAYTADKAGAITNTCVFNGSIWAYLVDAHLLVCVPASGTAKTITVTGAEALSGTSPVYLSICGGSLYLTQIGGTQTKILLFELVSFKGTETSIQMTAVTTYRSGSVTQTANQYTIPYVVDVGGTKMMALLMNDSYVYYITWKAGEYSTTASIGQGYCNAYSGSISKTYTSRLAAKLGFSVKNQNEAIYASRFLGVSDGNSYGMKFWFSIGSLPQSLYGTPESDPYYSFTSYTNMETAIEKDARGKYIQKFFGEDYIPQMITLPAGANNEYLYNVDLIDRKATLMHGRYNGGTLPEWRDINIKLPSRAVLFTDSVCYVAEQSMWFIFVGTGLLFGSKLATSGWGYIDTMGLLGLIAKNGCITYLPGENALYLSGLNSAGIPVVCKLLFDGLMDFSGEGAWLPVMSKDGIPAYIKARST